MSINVLEQSEISLHAIPYFPKFYPVAISLNLALNDGQIRYLSLSFDIRPMLEISCWSTGHEKLEDNEEGIVRLRTRSTKREVDVM